MQKIIAFALFALFASSASATVVCDSGWSVYPVMPKDGSFPIYGCDSVYAELMKNSLAKKKCTLVNTIVLCDMCFTNTGGDKFPSTCHSNGKYAFSANVQLNCKDKVGPYKTHAIAIGTMKDHKFIKTDITFYDHEI